MNQTDPKLRPTGRSWTYKNGWIGDDDFTEGNIISKTKLQGLNFQEQWIMRMRLTLILYSLWVGMSGPYIDMLNLTQAM